MYTILRLSADYLSAHELLTHLEDVRPQFARHLSSPSAARRYLLVKFGDTLEWHEHRQHLLNWLGDHAEALAYCVGATMTAQLDTAVFADEMPEFCGCFVWPLEDLRRLIGYGVSLELSVYRPVDPAEVIWSAADRPLHA
ncbi:hypothetical protein [Deinococcus sp.]|uniref:hypothetical protein n=1 Tax=Deinococcus sp. TaxID=47478 RepID=UPI0025ED6338|nr:hypothetical protein [Deinococcus sp.]